MRSLNFGRSVVTLAGLLAIASVVACSDNTTSPTAPAVSASPIASANPRIDSDLTTVVIKINDIWGNPLQELGTVRFMGKDTTDIVDNSPGDVHMAKGSIVLHVPKAAFFTACLLKDTKSYGIDVTNPYCSTAVAGIPSTILPPLTMRAFPIVGFYSQDLAGTSIAGGAVSVVAPPSDGFSASASDNGAIGGDLSAAGDGKIVLRANRPGTYSWCETAAPAGYYLTSPSCGTVNLSWDLSTGIILKHKKKVIVINPF